MQITKQIYDFVSLPLLTDFCPKGEIDDSTSKKQR